MKRLLGLLLIMVFATISFGQRTVGQIEASDPDGDILTFEWLEQRPAVAFGVTPDGELYVSDEETLATGEWEVDVRVTDDGIPQESAEATMFITVYSLSGEGDTTILDSIICYKYEILQLDSTFTTVIDSTLTQQIDSILIPAYWEYDTTYSWQYDTTTLINFDTTKLIFTPNCDYDVDTIPPQ